MLLGKKRHRYSKVALVVISLLYLLLFISLTSCGTTKEESISITYHKPDPDVNLTKEFNSLDKELEELDKEMVFIMKGL